MSVVRAESPHVVRIGLKLFFARLFLPQDRYNKYVYNQSCTIDKLAFPAYAETLIECLKLTKKKSVKYKNSDSESGVIVAAYPIFRPYYKMVYDQVRKHRGKCGLLQ